jgi:hypothetical protein
MRSVLSIPPLRDLPPHRLAQRREHLLAEIAQPPSRRPLPRRGLLGLAAAALIVVVGTASAIGGVRDFILDRGFVGLPPVGATPSTPESGELVVRYLGEGVTQETTLVPVWVYADGRMIWSREGRPAGGRPTPEGANDLTSGYLEQRLTPEGVELLQSEVAELLDRSRALLERLPADYDPLAEMRAGRWGGSALFVAESGAWGSVEVRDGDRLLRLQWQPGGGKQSPKFEGTIATPEQLADLRRIDALLTDPASVLPSSAWAVRKVRAYVPSHYQACLQTAPPRDDSQLLSLLPTPAADLLRDKSRTRLEGDVVASPDGGGPVAVQGRSVTYCSTLTTEEARELAESLSGLDNDPRLARLQYRLAEAAPGAHWWERTEIWFEPYFPHGQVTCSVCG